MNQVNHLQTKIYRISSPLAEPATTLGPISWKNWKRPTRGKSNRVQDGQLMRKPSILGPAELLHLLLDEIHLFYYVRLYQGIDVRLKLDSFCL